jgi:putative restriction endonuclease
MVAPLTDERIRLAAFDWLQEQTEIHGDLLPWSLITTGFLFKGQQITLAGAKGIWKPRVMVLPLSITTSPNSPYEDRITDSHFLHYKYRGDNPMHSDNVGLREAMRRKIPLVYFYGITKGKYLATWPVYVIGDSAKDLNFTIAVDSMNHILQKTSVDDPERLYQRAYLTVTTLKRLHQRSFRERVMMAYRSQCSLCSLRHEELLDAAHIIVDKEDQGDPVIQNGLSLCKIHHAAFDKHILGISPDYTIKIRRDILEEIDGPMLKYGIQSLDGGKIILPGSRRDWPDRVRLERRFEDFLRAG